MIAAIDIFHAIPASADRKCSDDNPEKKSCVWVSANAVGDAERGVFTVGVGSGGGGPEGFVGVLGRLPDGSWGYWYGMQNTTFHLTRLPGDMIVCADGQGLNLRASPSLDAAVVMLMTDGTKVRAEEFQLPRRRRDTTDDLFLEGWYRLSAPDAGWAHANYLADAAEGDCKLRNGQQRR